MKESRFGIKFIHDFLGILVEDVVLKLFRLLNLPGDLDFQ